MSMCCAIARDVIAWMAVAKGVVFICMHGVLYVSGYCKSLSFISGSHDVAWMTLHESRCIWCVKPVYSVQSSTTPLPHFLGGACTAMYFVFLVHTCFVTDFPDKNLLCVKLDLGVSFVSPLSLTPPPLWSPPQRRPSPCIAVSCSLVAGTCTCMLDQCLVFFGCVNLVNTFVRSQWRYFNWWWCSDNTQCKATLNCSVVSW